jgi:eukaryotic-like serine/threonine-protein kinase
VTDSSSMLGRTVSHYRIVAELGSGGMGVVYRAEDLKLERSVALKFLSERYASDSRSLERFVREARATSALNHPNICTIYEIDEVEGLTFIAMELIEGRSLQMESSGKALGLETVLNLGLQLAAGLEAAHLKGIVHRDIKPANLYITSKNQLKILDFGLAKLISPIEIDDLGDGVTLGNNSANLTSAGMAVGTVAYMSPEQARGEEIDARSDLFSAGSVLYELAAGMRPFAGKTSAIVFESILNRDPIPVRSVNPALPAELERIIEKSLEKNRDFRYQHAADLSADLKRLNHSTFRTEHRPESSSSTLLDTSPPVHTVSGGSSASIFAAAKQYRYRSAAFVVLLLGVFVAAGYGIFELVRKPKPIAFENYVMTQPTEFGDVENVAASPDGKYLAFVRGAPGTTKKSLWLRQLSTNSTSEVQASVDPVLSLSFTADQAYLLYRIQRSESSSFKDLYRVPILGGSPQIVVQDIDGDVSFTDGGKRWCFQRNTGEPRTYSIVLLNSKTGAETVAVHGDAPVPHAVACSPDGKAVVLSWARFLGSPENFLSVADLPGGTPRVFVKLGMGIATVESLAWLPRQQGIIFANRTAPGFRSQLVYAAYPDGTQRRITNDLSSYDSVGLSSDGTILAALKRDTTSTFSIWTAEHGEDSTIGHTAKDPVFFTWIDSNKILFNTLGMELRSTNLTTGEATSISTDQGHTHWQPSWCGRDEIVAYGNNDSLDGVWRLNLTSGVYKQITNGYQDLFPQCTLDGKWIVYGDSVKRKLMRAPADGGDPTEIPGQANIWFDLSRDGTQLVDLNAFEQQPEGKTRPVLHLVSTNNWQETATLPLDPMDIARPMVRFTPDGKGVVFVAIVNGKQNFWEKRLDGQPVRQLTHFDNNDRIEDFRWSPDGKRLGIIRNKQSVDAVLFRDNSTSETR